jgi:hypothetical protein
MENNCIPLEKEFLEKILKPVNRLTESCVLKTDKEGLYTICSSPDNTVILYARIKLPNELQEPIRLNLISIKKLLSGLECLGNDGDFSISYNENNIKCSVKDSQGESTHFKYHLVDDTVVRECPVNINKIAQLNFDTEFVLTNAKIKQIMSGYAFASDTTKIYFFTKDGNIYAEVNDRTLQNVDSITIKIVDEFQGEPIPDALPINMEVFKNLSSCRTDVKVKINNQYKVFIFQNKEDNDVELKYIISALVK